MFAGKTVLRRAATCAVVAALALTAVAPSVATAAPRAKGITVTSDATDISARRRVVRGGRGGAAAAAAFAGIVGTGLAIAATQNRRAYYDDYYGGGPVYGAPGPGYYYGGGGYSPYGYNPY